MFVLLCSLLDWHQEKRFLARKGHCQVCGRLKAVSIGRYPAQLFVLPTVIELRSVLVVLSCRDTADKVRVSTADGFTSICL